MSAPPATTIRFDPAEARYAALRRLSAQLPAAASDNADAAEIARLAAAWTAIREQASRVLVRGTTTAHPLAGRASFALAQLAQIRGDYALAERESNRAIAELAPFPDAYPRERAGALNLLGFMRTAAGQSAEAVEILAKSSATLHHYFDALSEARRTSEDYVAIAESGYAYGTALARVGRLDEAVEQQRAAVAALAKAKGENDGDTLVYRSFLANLLYRAERREEADRVARDTVERAAAHLKPTDSSYSTVLTTVGVLMTRNGQRAEGLKYLEQALESRRAFSGAEELNFLQQQQGYGLSLIEAQRYAEALPPLTRSLAGFRKINSPYDVLKAQSLVGLAQLAEGDTAQAAAALGAVAAGSASRDAKTREVTRVTLPALIVAAVDQGDLAQARRQADAFEADARMAQGLQSFLVADAAALTAYVALRAGTGSREEAIAAARTLVTVVRDGNTLVADGYLPRRERMALDLALRIAVAAQDPDLGLQAMAVLAGSRIAQANRLVVDRLVTGDPALAARVKAFQDQVLAVQRADTAWLLALTDTSANAAAARQTLTSATATLDTLRAGLTRDYPRWSESRGTRLASLGTLQAGLARKEGVLAVVPAFDGLYVLAASADRAVVLRSQESRAQLEGRLQRFRTSIAANTFDAAGATELHRLLLPPEVRTALGGVDRLRIIPVGAFAGLPFAALLEKPVARLDAGSPWLIRRYALSVAADFATPAGPNAAARGARPLLAVGAPDGLTGVVAGNRLRSIATFYRGGAVDAASIAALAPLPGAEREIDRIVARFGAAGSTRLIGGDATEAKLRSLDLRRYGTVLFATHGLVTGEMEGVVEPALVMTRDPETGGDGLLSASEVERLSLDADWVIVSACDTAAGENASAPAYSGLARAFRYAGARSLLVSHWPVRDDVAADLTANVIGKDAAQIRSDVALQHAMLRTMRTAGPDPYLWAPFILAVGG